MKIRLFVLFVALIGMPAASLPVLAEPTHAIAMHGKPALPADFKHFPYANPDAPKGGKITYGVVGTFDSVNRFILKSMRNAARGVRDTEFGNLVFESLMFRSRDEPFTIYGLLAEQVEWPDDRAWIEFTLNRQAKWSDGVPVTVEDVIFSFNLLQQKGRPPYSSRMNKIERIEKTGERKVRFVFNDQADREFPMIVALSPILPKHAIEVETFDQSTLEPMIGSGPYTMNEIIPGKSISYKRNDNYWAKDLPSRIGFSNFDTVRVEYYRNVNTQFEAFKKGLFDVISEDDPAAWRRNFEFPAVKEGKVTKDVFATGTPSNMLGFVFNTRKKVFSDKSVREALAMLFDFEWTNKNLYFGAYKRTVSFWHGSELSSVGNPATDREKELLAPYMSDIDGAVMDGTYQPPVSDGTGRDRKILRKAFRLLSKAGYTRDGGKLVDGNGTPLQFEILTRFARQEKLAIAYKRGLEKLGISVAIRTVDDAQYQQRVQTYDYDMVLQTYSASLSPGAEQIWRWGSRYRDVPGTFNFAGVQSPALDDMINQMLTAVSREDFVAAVRAYDRLLISGHYVVPLYHINEQWIARWNYIKHPENTALYGYRLETWWDSRSSN